jgi:hypothetical protein
MLEVYIKGNPRLSYTNANGTTSYHRFTDVDLRTGTWQHLTVVHDTASGEARCYVNGELKQTVTENVLDYSANALDQKFLIGRDTALRYAEGDGEYWENRKDQYFKGFIKELRLYSDVRSDSEIAADYAGSLDSSELIAAYEIDPEDAYTNLTDLSGNGYKVETEKLWLDKSEVEAAEGDYTFAIVGDTQSLVKKHRFAMTVLYDWIVENKEEYNIQYVMGLGDVTEDVNVAPDEYEFARENIYKLSGVVPFSIASETMTNTISRTRHITISPRTEGILHSIRRSLTKPTLPSLTAGTERVTSPAATTHSRREAPIGSSSISTSVLPTRCSSGRPTS